MKPTMIRPEANPTTPPALVRVCTDDFDELAGAFQRWDHRFRQFSPGSFVGSLTAVRLGPVQVMRIGLNRRVLAKGSPPPGCFTFNPVTAHNRAAVFRGQHLGMGQLNLLAPGVEMNHLTSEDYCALLVTVPEELLFATAARCEAELGHDLVRGLSLPPDLRRCLAFNDHLDRLLMEVEGCPERLDDAQVARRLGEDCLTRLVALLVNPTADEERAVPGARAVRLVLRAEEMMEASLAGALSTEDLCADLEVSERTLRGAFRQVCRLSPIASYKIRRLNAVRRDLKTGAGHVHEIAQRWGFWHTGEFAADYQRLFGERPSQTLRRGLRSSSRQ